MRKLVLIGLLFGSGCATLGHKGQLDPVVIKDLLCAKRESEVREYMLQKGYKFADIVERLERARKECPK